MQAWEEAPCHTGWKGLPASPNSSQMAMLSEAGMHPPVHARWSRIILCETTTCASRQYAAIGSHQRFGACMLYRMQSDLPCRC